VVGPEALATPVSAKPPTPRAAAATVVAMVFWSFMPTASARDVMDL
jgi:hypothetical protein